MTNSTAPPGGAQLHSPVLEAFSVEREMLRARLAAIDEAQAVFERMLGGAGMPAPIAPTEPSGPSASARRQPKSTANAASGNFEPARPSPEEIVKWMATQPGPVARGEVVAALGGHRDTVGGKLQTLCKEGLIVAHGSGSTRRYSAPAERTPPVALPTPPADDVVLDAIREHGPIVAGELRRIVGKPRAEVNTAVDRLHQAGHVDGIGNGSMRLLWVSSQPRDTQREVLALVAYAPAELDEPKLIRMLDAGFSEVVDAVSELVDDGALQRDNSRMLTTRGADDRP